MWRDLPQPPRRYAIPPRGIRTDDCYGGSDRPRGPWSRVLAVTITVGVVVLAIAGMTLLIRAIGDDRVPHRPGDPLCAVVYESGRVGLEPC